MRSVPQNLDWRAKTGSRLMRSAVLVKGPIANASKSRRLSLFFRLISLIRRLRLLLFTGKLPSGTPFSTLRRVSLWSRKVSRATVKLLLRNLPKGRVTSVLILKSLMCFTLIFKRPSPVLNILRGGSLRTRWKPVSIIKPR